MSRFVSEAFPQRDESRRDLQRWRHAALMCLLAVVCLVRLDSVALDEPVGPPRLSEVMAGEPVGRAVYFELVTSLGVIPCELRPEQRPQASALFLGFALGRAAWRDPRSGRVRYDPLYRDLPFVRGVPGALIQSGDPVGNATGHPGYRIAVESAADDPQLLAEPGALVLARYTSPPNRVDPTPPPAGHVLGSQFALLLSRSTHLRGLVTVLGRCRELSVARAIADAMAAQRARPTLLEVRLVDPRGATRSASDSRMEGRGPHPE